MTARRDAPTAEYSADVLAELAARVAASLPQWGLPEAASVRLLNVSENATYLVNDGRGRVPREWVLRVHRVGYSNAEEIRSELAWMAALRHDGVIETAATLTGTDGEAVQVLASRQNAPPRFAVAFERLPGREPEAGDALHWFERLGEVTARMHRHARSWTLPAGFRRKRWDFDAMVGPTGFWGDWRAARGLDAAGASTIAQALELIRVRLARHGSGAETFGLVHADLRLANLLVDGRTLRIIDFDDCGFSWFLYDFATAVSFIEHEPALPDLLRAWVVGYRRVRELEAGAVADLPVFVILRRILLTAWLASHAEVPFAQATAASYVHGTVALARELLEGTFLTQAAD